MSRCSHAARRARQQGLSVITAIFLLLLMSLLGAAMATLLGTAHINTAADIGGSRAFLAARAGVEWGLFQLDPNATNAAMPACFAPGTPAVPDHTVNVACENWDYTEAGRTIRIYRITATATALGVKAPGIERQIIVTVEKCRDPGIAVAPFDC